MARQTHSSLEEVKDMDVDEFLADARALAKITARENRPRGRR
ncbi:hypothetical protein [Hoeflea sp.]